MKVSVWALFFLSALVAISGARGKEVLKVCGRDFIRAIVYTCGSSRWKRDLHNALEDGAEGEFEAPNEYGASEDLVEPSLFSVESPAGETRTQKHRPAGTAQRKRQADMADLATFCCRTGCTATELSKLC
ncbi:insulin-like peptide INSL5 [Antechinus flavipes]|uniref:insulin-like peptide INSL5 n=1 Tax=Antechinus flavipes TaxID=38775 RepID=UPI002235ED8B|nr:insulin-like peptide INSL5 [Antechinus flavipes]